MLNVVLSSTVTEFSHYVNIIMCDKLSCENIWLRVFWAPEFPLLMPRARVPLALARARNDCTSA